MISRSFARLERAARWHFPPIVNWIFPGSLKNGLRNLREQIVARSLARRLPSGREFEQSAEGSLASASLSIIVPVHDAPEVTERCLASLEKYARSAEIILVDDASALEQTRSLLESFTRRNHWKLIRHEKALGHSAACAAGASVAEQTYLCLLNSDTVVTPWCWLPIAQAFRHDSQIGVAGPSTSSSGTRQTTPLTFQARHYLSDGQIFEYARRLWEDSPEADLTDLPWVSGFALFIRRTIWEQLGGFDANLPDYCNDVELCRRVVCAGYRVVWVRNSYIHHFAGVSYEKTIGASGRDVQLAAGHAYIKQKHRSADL